MGRWPAPRKQPKASVFDELNETLRHDFLTDWTFKAPELNKQHKHSHINIQYPVRMHLLFVRWILLDGAYLNLSWGVHILKQSHGCQHARIMTLHCADSDMVVVEVF